MLNKPVLQFCVALLLIKRMDKKIHHGLPSHRVQHLKECFQQNYIAPRKPCINVATQFLQSKPNKNPPNPSPNNFKPVELLRSLAYTRSARSYNPVTTTRSPQSLQALNPKPYLEPKTLNPQSLAGNACRQTAASAFGSSSALWCSVGALNLEEGFGDSLL